MDLDGIIIDEIKNIASKYDYINKVVLFGSRARGDNKVKSDIDLAIYSNNSIYEFIEDIENNTTTLLEYDYTHMDKINDELLLNEINKDGIVLYEKL